jgi:hypothetical protein
MAPTLTNSITVALTSEQYLAIQREADLQGLTLAEVARPVLARTLAPDPIETIALAEILGLRALMITLFAKLAAQVPITDGLIRDEIAVVDANKIAWAREQLAKAGPR